jgi:two-component system, response regulator PdtaR
MTEIHRHRPTARAHFGPQPKCRRVVLVVEDDPLIRMGAIDMVKSAGFEAVEAASASEAIDKLETQPDIHLVFTDVTMPGSMDGLKLAYYVRDRWPPVLLIIVSGKTAIGIGQVPIGARFFPKPYSDRLIVEAMNSMLATLDVAA